MDNNSTPSEPEMVTSGGLTNSSINKKTPTDVEVELIEFRLR